MSLEDGLEAVDRIIAACDRLDATHPVVARAVRARANQRLGNLRRVASVNAARPIETELLELADDLTRLVDDLDRERAASAPNGLRLSVGLTLGLTSQNLADPHGA